MDFIIIYIDNLIRSYVLSAFPTFEEALDVDMSPSIDACPALQVIVSRERNVDVSNSEKIKQFPRKFFCRKRSY